MNSENIKSEVEILREENNELLKYVFQLEGKLFLKMDSYRLVEEKSKVKCLSNIERKQLCNDINCVFYQLIKILKTACILLTEEDLMFCCFSIMKIHGKILRHCMGTTSKYASNQRRYRIKKKMKLTSCSNLYEIIFQKNYR